MKPPGVEEDVVAEVGRAAGERARVGLGVEHGEPLLERVVHAAAGRELDDQVGLLAQRRRRCRAAGRVERRPVLAVADVHVDQRRAGRLARRRRSRRAPRASSAAAGTSALAVSAPVGATVIRVLATLRAVRQGAHGAHPASAGDRLPIRARRSTVCAAERSSTRSSSVGSVLRLTTASAIGPSLVVARDRRHVADRRGHRPGPSLALRRQDVARPVEVQEDQPTRRPAEVVHPRDRLLPAVAALVQVHGRAQPVDLVRDGAVVGLEAEPRTPRGDAQRLGRPECRRAADRPRPPRDRRAARAPRASARSVPGWPVDRAVRRGVADAAPGHGSRQARGSPSARLAAVRLAEHGPVGGDVGDLDPQHEAHRVEPGDQRLRRCPARR